MRGWLIHRRTDTIGNSRAKEKRFWQPCHRRSQIAQVWKKQNFANSSRETAIVGESKDRSRVCLWWSSSVCLRASLCLTQNTFSYNTSIGAVEREQNVVEILELGGQQDQVGNLSVGSVDLVELDNTSSSVESLGCRKARPRRQPFHNQAN
jgi:hypothetical protein